MQQSIFISYSGQDRTVADKVCDVLEGNGLRCWIAHRDITPGREWGEAIIEAIANCQILLVIFSSNSNNSLQVRQEVERAVGRGIYIIPLRIKNEKPTGSMELFLSSRHWVDVFTEPFDEDLQALSVYIRVWLKNKNRGNKSVDTKGEGLKQLDFLETSTKQQDLYKKKAIEREEDQQFSDSVCHHMATFNISIEKLTLEQLNVIRQLRGMRRVRISGCAGSGKTLVAAEKAIRLSNAGLFTFFICHSPLLADHVRQLTSNSGVQVETFGEWITSINGTLSNYDSQVWTNFDEPDVNSINQAFDKLVGNGKFDAVIVDEGQDFRDEWWTVVEASLIDPQNSILYIFHDDHQAILPYRAKYPIQQPSFDLSKNCRNAGKIYEIVRHFHPQAAVIENNLKNLGNVLILAFEPHEVDVVFNSAFNWISENRLLGSLVALHAGITPLEESLLIKKSYYQTNLDWQSEVRNKFRFAIRTASLLGIPPGGQQEVFKKLEKLSEAVFPTQIDVDLVNQIAKTFSIRPETRRKILNNPELRASMTWIIRDGKLVLWKYNRPQLWATEVILHFERQDWHLGIPETNPISFNFKKPKDYCQSGSVPIFRVGDFKGLESDAILLHLQGPAPIAKEEIYIGISRARMLLVILVDKRVISSLPLPIRSLVV